MRRALFALLVLAVGTAMVVHEVMPAHEAVAALPQVPAKQVQSVSLDATDGAASSLPTGALRSHLVTQVGATLDEAALEHDRAALEKELADRGYLAARVAKPSVDISPQGGAYIVFDITRGPMFHLRNVAVTGPGSREVGVVTLAAGDDAVVDRIAHAKQALVETLARRGQKTSVDLIQHLDVAAAALDLTIATR